MDQKEGRANTGDLKQLEQDMNQRAELYRKVADNLWSAVDDRAKSRKAAADDLERRQTSLRRMLWIICMILAAVVAVVFYQAQLGMLV